ncbi:uncharacterized protein [Drosophila pseudoobscura]|uniref:Protein Mabiki n=1 Tax=Drosophila pseudoobscura pseudoobscura TaxID=46245 RepID=A0A6I8UY99_DROPS|nr:uncharacterized protein LOC6902638 [Drosophila pseudoobscura]
MDNSTTTSSYTHKKFSAKRKLEIDQGLDSSMDSLMYQGKPAAKRRQTKALFRPWLDKNHDQNTEASPPTAGPPESAAPALGPTCRPTLTETPRQRSPQEHQRRDRSLLASLLSRRAEQAQAQYLENMAKLEQQVRVNLFYRQLLRQAVFQRGVAAPNNLLPRQQQQFLQQMALSQQMLVFGAQH